MKSIKIVFDGQVYAQRVTGQYRYADEMLRELDQQIEKDAYEIVIPNYVNIENKFKNIKVVHHGNVRGLLWTQTNFFSYLCRTHAIGVGFCNVTPLLRPGIAVVHDIGYKVLRDQYKNLYGRLSALWHRLNYWVIARSGKPVLTVSEFSKGQISKVYGVHPERIHVIGPAWQHILRILEDESIFEENPSIRRGRYFFALGSLEERKNFQWIVEVAKLHPEEQFVIAGGRVKNAKEAIDFDAIPNVIFVGFVSDAAVKALMKGCRAFLFPSTFEGFGLPPLEALALGKDVIASNASSIPEILGGSARYICPTDVNVDFDELLRRPADPPESRLSCYAWEQSAGRLIKILTEYARERNAAT